MTSPWTKTVALFAWCGSLAACGGGRGAGEEPVNIDYSALRLASSHEGALSYATSDEQLLRALRNGLRMSLVGAPQVTCRCRHHRAQRESAGHFLSHDRSGGRRG